MSVLAVLAGSGGLDTVRVGAGRSLRMRFASAWMVKWSASMIWVKVYCGSLEGAWAGVGGLVVWLFGVGLGVAFDRDWVVERSCTSSFLVMTGAREPTMRFVCTEAGRPRRCRGVAGG